jgi:hypothetical protein
MDEPDGDQKNPHYILVDRVKHAASHHDIERDFRNHGEKQQSQNIFFQIFRVKIAFHNHECKNGKRNSSNAGQPVIAGNDGSPKVVAHHEQHRHYVQCQGGYFKFRSFFYHLPFSPRFSSVGQVHYTIQA